ncbi:MAG: hypothetical protein AAB727_01530 [Patescibacteria group bacterium]
MKHLSTVQIHTRPIHLLSIFVLLWLLGFNDALAFSLPLIFGCADGGGGGGGGDGGDSSGSVSESCGNGGGQGQGGGSTPFLCTWDGEKFTFENDFLYGKPISSFYDIKEGIRLYEDRAIVPDTYKIQNKIHIKNNRALFQIKEIEPEESFIDHISLSRVVHPRNTELIVDSSFKKFIVLENTALAEKEGIISQEIYFNGENFSDTLGDNARMHTQAGREDGYFIDPTGDIVEIRGNIRAGDNDTYLLIRSHFRDWTLGEIFDMARGRKSFSIREIFSDMSPRSMVKGSALAFLILVLGAVTAIGTFFQRSPREYTLLQAKTLSGAFDIPRALADVPAPPGGGGHSLIVEGWNGASFQTIDVFSPRYYQPTLNAIAIPKNVVQDNGDVHIRITSTKRHKIHYTSLIVPREESSYRTETFSVSKAFLQREKRDYATTLNEPYSGEYMHVIPGDIVDVEFPVIPTNIDDNEQESYLLQAGGVYTDASEETQRLAGDWVSNLDPEAKSFLQELYSLRRYHDAGRVPLA